MSELDTNDLKSQIDNYIFDLINKKLQTVDTRYNDILSNALNKKTVKQLQLIAKQLKIPRFSRMRKPQLILEISKFY